MEFNIYSIPSFISFLINLNLTLIIFILYYRERHNIIFGFLLLAFALWSFFESAVISSQTEKLALLLARMLWTPVSLLGPLYIHFALAFPSYRKILKIRFIKLLLYIPGIFFIIITWNTDLLIKGVSPTYWANYYQTYGPFFIVYSIYFELMLILGLFLFYRLWKKSPIIKEKLQAKWMFIATLIPIVGASITNVILPAFGFYIFPLGCVFTSVMSIIVGIFLIKYKIIYLTPQYASEMLINMFPGIVFLLDPETNILYTNVNSNEILGYNENELIGKPISYIISEKDRKMGLPWYHWNIKENIKPTKCEFICKDGKSISVSFRGIIIDDIKSEVIGLIAIAQPD